MKEILREMIQKAYALLIIFVVIIAYQWINTENKCFNSVSKFNN